RSCGEERSRTHAGPGADAPGTRVRHKAGSGISVEYTARMAQEQSLIIVGASARAAAFSALRAGLRPWCIDLFADADLRARCPVTHLEPDRYPYGLAELLPQAPPGPWMYTGGLENRPNLIRRLARGREL